MISTEQLDIYGIKPSKDFMCGLGTDPSASIKTERLYMAPLMEKQENGEYKFAETADQLIEENFTTLTLMYYTLAKVCAETKKLNIDIVVDGISCFTTDGGKTVHFNHFGRD